MALKSTIEQLHSDPVVFTGADAERFAATMDEPNPEQAARVESAVKAFDAAYSSEPANALFD
ncbi:MAG: hypothetical protein JHC95_19955 [Solirubrobacteraceae bacterium]|nr:hypothetical protein [Solirubrobacteraceae bacterium]